MSETIEPYTYEEFVRKQQESRARLGLAPMKVIRRGESTRTGTRIQCIRNPDTDSLEKMRENADRIEQQIRKIEEDTDENV